MFGILECNHCTSDFYCGFFVLVLAASILNLDHLRLFSVEAADATSDSGILHETFKCLGKI